MKIVGALLFAVLSAVPAAAQPAGTAGVRYRCEVGSPTRGTASDGGPERAQMTVVSDGLACNIVYWNVPPERRTQPATGDVIVPAQHGTAVFLGPSLRYTAERDYVGRDAFVYRSTSSDASGAAHVMTVRVEVDVRAAPFERTPGLASVHVLIPSMPVRVGNDVPAPRKTKDAKPLYPRDAELARTQGQVTLDATVDPDGRVSSARVVRSIPGLDAAAIAAVRQWEFAPTTINGRAVPVLMTVAVTFALPDSAAPAPPPSPAVAAAQPIRLGPGMPSPQVLKRVTPQYTAEALRTGVQGTVTVDATVDTQGRVIGVTVIRSVPLLDEAAIAAARQWEFAPTVLNGAAVPVIVSLDLTFAARPSPSPPPAAVPSVTPSGTYRVGRDVPAPKKTKDVKPVYPAAAQSARVQGVVIMEITIGTDGKVTDARVMRSVPMLDEASLATVRQWEFEPSILNGKPVPVLMTVTNNYTLDGGTAPSAPPSIPVPSVSVPAGRGGAPLDADLTSAFDLLQQRQFENALKAFREANNRRGQNCAVCYMGMAGAFELMGAARDVVESCDRALAIEKTDKALIVHAHQLKAIALQDLPPSKDPRRLREAEDALRAAIAIDPKANYLHFNLGLVLLRQGRDTDGVLELNEELALRPASPHADRARGMIENPRRAREAFAPDFSLVTLQREFLDLAGLKGKVVLLDFWGTWCPPCVRAVPALRALQKRHSEDPFVMISVSSDSDEAVVRGFTDKNQMQWPQYWDRDRKVQQAFEVRAWPTYVLIDAEGIVRFRTTGGGPIEPEGLEKAIKSQLKAAAAGAGKRE